MHDRPIHDSVEALWPHWQEAAGRPAVDAAVASLYKQLDEAVAARGPTCWVSGRCCNFNAFGHDLFVTGLEIAWVLRMLRNNDIKPGAWKERLSVESACPFQVERLCSVHAIRPLGCRVFFCQEGTQGWQQEIYEAFLGELRGLHDQNGIEYRYMEWRRGLISAAEAFE